MIKLDKDALIERFRVQWASLRPTVPIAWENAPAIDPAPTGPYVAYFIRTGRYQRRYVGEGPGWYHGQGRVLVQVFTPKEGETAISDALSDDAVAIYRRWRSADAAVRTEGDVEPTVVPGDPNWHQVNVSIPYTSWRWL
ncbi:MAG: phage tail terminator-like protein [Pseudomonadota bacterium]|nr:phage tail terminator-like protein [Pseudomonadota bacterium]